MAKPSSSNSDWAVSETRKPVAARPALYGAAFNPYCRKNDDQLLATVGGNAATIYKFRVKSKKFDQLISYEDENTKEALYVVCWAYLKEGRMALCVGGQLGVIRVIDTEAGTTARLLHGHGQSLCDIRHHPSLRGIIATSSEDLSAIIWNVNQHMPLIRLGGYRGHRNQVLSLDWSECGEFVITASMDHQVMCWSLKGFYMKKIRCSMTGEKFDAHEVLREDFPKTTDEAVLKKIRLEKTYEDMLMINEPCAKSNDFHWNYIDCLRVVKGFCFSKSVYQDAIMIWKFGTFEDGVAGLEHVIKTENTSSFLAQLVIPENNWWFNKFDIDPSFKWLACGIEGSVHIFNIDGENIFNKNAVKSVSTGRQSKDDQMRQICFEPYGRFMAAVGDKGHIVRIDLKSALDDELNPSQ
ncbi:unnamed protein product, partial [Mesorhabditis spiculigera]